ncbi:MAG: hypothetical protein ACTSUN_08405 [Promethearchaeota archaeon]
MREAKSPLDILGVLDVLKYKIQEWNNTNIFSYKGVLFEHQPILVIGSDTIDEAGKITILVYITRIIENKTDVSLSHVEKIKNSSSLKNFLEQYVKKKISMLVIRRILSSKKFYLKIKLSLSFINAFFFALPLFVVFNIKGVLEKF